MSTRVLAAWLLLAACSSQTPQQVAVPATPAAQPVSRVLPTPPMPPPPTLRLPATVAPRRQAVTLALDPDREDFQGNPRIELELRERTNVIWLHADGLVIHRVQASGAPVEFLTPLQTD